MPSPRVYRHRPFLAGLAVCKCLVASWIVLLVAWMVRNPGIEPAAKGVLFLVPLLVFLAFLVGMWRVRTVVDDTGITQHWITSSYRVRFEEITGTEIEHHAVRWFLRVRCRERTVEVIPCHTLLPMPLSEAFGPPRALAYARADIDRSAAGDRA